MKRKNTIHTAPVGFDAAFARWVSAENRSGNTPSGRAILSSDPVWVVSDSTQLSTD